MTTRVGLDWERIGRWTDRAHRVSSAASTVDAAASVAAAPGDFLFLARDTARLMRSGRRVRFDPRDGAVYYDSRFARLDDEPWMNGWI